MQTANSPMGRLILEASTGIHGYIAKSISTEWARMAEQREDLADALRVVRRSLGWQHLSREAQELVSNALDKATG